MKHHVVSVKAYILVFLALMVMTGLTVYVAKIDFGPFNDVVALGIALIKMLLVATIFMHLKYSAKLLWLTAGAGLIWLIVMFAITMSDYNTRDWQQNPEPWAEMPALEVPTDAGHGDAGHH